MDALTIAVAAVAGMTRTAQDATVYADEVVVEWRSHGPLPEITLATGEVLPSITRRTWFAEAHIAGGLVSVT